MNFAQHAQRVHERLGAQGFVAVDLPPDDAAGLAFALARHEDWGFLLLALVQEGAGEEEGRRRSQVAAMERWVRELHRERHVPCYAILAFAFDRKVPDEESSAVKALRVEDPEHQWGVVPWALDLAVELVDRHTGFPPVGDEISLVLTDVEHAAAERARPLAARTIPRGEAAGQGARRYRVHSPGMSRLGFVPATRAILALTVAWYLWTVLLGGGGLNGLIGGPSTKSALLWGATHGTLVYEYGQQWRLFTYAFLHGSVLHIAMNMYVLWSVGRYVELIFGSWRMLFIYLLGGVGGGVVTTVFRAHAITTVGASGAILGLMGALLYFAWASPGRRLDWRGILQPVLINLVFGFMVGGIDNAAHIGGVAGGFAAAFLLGIPGQRAAWRNVATAAAGLLVLALLAGFVPLPWIPLF